MNLEYLPEMIVVTFAKHKEVLKVLQRGIVYPHWEMAIRKIDFILPVRNHSATEPLETRYIPKSIKKHHYKLFQ